MEGHYSHASVNPDTANTLSHTTSNVGTTSTNRDIAWEWGVQKDPLEKQIFGAPCVTKEYVEGSQG